MQLNLDDFGETPGGNTDTSRSSTGLSPVALAESHLAPDAQPFNDESCPWCCAPPEHFEETAEGQVGCGHCDAIIPVDADWYQRGEKIVL